MTPANKTKIQKASQDLFFLADHHMDTQAQDVSLYLLRTIESIQSVITDCVMRPEVNDGINSKSVEQEENYSHEQHNGSHRR